MNPLTVACAGTALYESFLGSGWNIGWTMLPILALGFFDQDLDANVALANPKGALRPMRPMRPMLMLLRPWLRPWLRLWLRALLTCHVVLPPRTVYIGGHKRIEFNAIKIAQWIINAIAHSLIIYGLTYAVFNNTIYSWEG